MKKIFTIDQKQKNTRITVKSKNTVCFPFVFLF